MENPLQRRTDTDKETARIEAFSDGVFSIAITLLVLDIHVPSIEQADATGLLSQLLHLWPNLLAFVASFFFILVMCLIDVVGGYTISIIAAEHNLGLARVSTD